MAYGPMSVGSDGTFDLLTDKTLTTEDVPADAKAAAFAMYAYPKNGSYELTLTAYRNTADPGDSL